MLAKSGMAAQLLGFGQPPGSLEGGREVVAGVQGVGVGVAEDLLAVGQGALEQGDGLGEAPGGLVGAREVVAGGQGVGVGVAEDLLAVGQGALKEVPGWVSPRTCSESARVRSRRGMALGQPSGGPVGIGEICVGGQGIGIIGAQQSLAVSGQRFGRCDGQAGAVAQGVQQIHRPQPQPQQGRRLPREQSGGCPRGWSAR